MRRDDAGTGQGVQVAGIDLKVVDDTFVGHDGLRGGHARHPVAPRDLALRCIRPATDANA
jgi:hypothetical protein